MMFRIDKITMLISQPVRNSCVKLLLAVALISCLVTCTGNQDILTEEERSWLQQHRDELVFAPDPDYAPYEFRDASDGLYHGMAYEYMQLVEKKLGVSFQRATYSDFNGILHAAKSGQVAIVNAVTSTPAREEFLLFTEQYVEVPNVVISRTKSNIESISDLEGARIALTRDYAVSEYYEKTFPYLRYEKYDSNEKALFAVSVGVADAAVMDVASALFLIEKNRITNLRVAADTFYPVRLSIASRRDLPELNIILNKALASITSEEHEDIKQHWIRLDSGSLFSHPLFWIIIGGMFGLGTFGAIIILGWNKTLKSQVRKRTAELAAALNRLQRAHEIIVSKNQELEVQNEEYESVNEELSATLSELNESQAILQQSLQEKEILLRELYHRTKNNMQVISSLLQLQVSKKPDNEEMQEFVDTANSRIQSMSLVHRMLYQSGNLSNISIAGYIRELVTQVAGSYAFDKKIETKLDVQDHSVAIEMAMPLGLVLNELLMNSVKYAFADGREGVIHISYRFDGNVARITYCDNGPGLPQGHDPERSESIGLTLVYSICEQQLHGNVAIDQSDGLCYTITFPADNIKI